MSILDAVVLAVGILAFAVILFWRFWFCRMPHRRVTGGERLIVSPACGTVALVRRFDTRSITAEKWNKAAVEILCGDVAPRGHLVLIVMTPLDVHYQRAPVAGKVLDTEHVPGAFRNALKEPATLRTLRNERNDILIEGKRGRVKVVQIAGFLARRISCFVTRGDSVAKGAAIGFINMGSQVAIILPEKARLRVAAGAKVIDGETVIGEFP
jgi:phosphatidylserine decarboxylase